MAVNLNRKNPTAIICLSPNAGGMEIDAIKLAKKLSPYMHITIIAKENHFIANSNADYVGHNGIELETIPFLFSISPSIICRVRRIIQEKGIKNIIFFGASELKSLYFSFLGLDINLIIRHGTTKSTPKKDWFHRLIYSNVNYHVAICKHLQKNVDFIIPFGQKSQSKLIYSSVNLPNFHPTKSDRFTLLNVGRIEAGKGQADAIQACNVLYEKGIDFHFYLVGGIEPKYHSTFMNFYDSLPYKDKITLVGHTTNVVDYYAKADLFIFPSYGEGLSNAFLEALSCGLECIAYDNTSFPELKELGLDFHLIEDKNIDQLSHTLLHCTQNRSTHQSNITKVAEKFSAQTEIKHYLELLV